MLPIPDHITLGHPEAQGPKAPVVAFRNWRVTDAGLCSLRTGAVWRSRELTAECRPQRLVDLVLPAHSAPDARCSCGIHAYRRFDPRPSMVDHRGVTGVVTLWGRVEREGHGLRAQHARVECLGVYERWASRQKQAVAAVAENLGCELVELQRLPFVAARYADPLPAAFTGATGRSL